MAETSFAWLRQVGHQGAQNQSSTGFPANDAPSKGCPSTVVPANFSMSGTGAFDVGRALGVAEAAGVGDDAAGVDGTADGVALGAGAGSAAGAAQPASAITMTSATRRRMVGTPPSSLARGAVGPPP